MSTDTVTIGCKLHNGYILEVGLQTIVKDDKGVEFVRVTRLPSYKRVVLKGSNAHRPADIQLPMGVARVYLNRGISKDFWTQWLKEHKNNYFVREGHIFEAQTEADAQVKMLDAEKAPAVLDPLDKTKMVVPGITQRVDEVA